MNCKQNATILLSLALLATAGVRVAMINATRSDNQRLIEAQEEKKREEQAKAMIAAARSGHLDEIKRLLEAKADVDAEINAAESRLPGLKIHYHMTPLMVAAARGNLPMVNTLIAAGAKVNAQSDEGKTALIYASRGMTALMFAADKGSLPIVNALIAAGADVNSQNSFHKTALDLAIQPDVINALKAAGAKPGSKNMR